MVNVNYRRGRAKEYRTRDKFREKGFIVLRTSGSHGFADLIAIDEKLKKIVFIQCKPKKFSKNKADELNEKYKWINDEFMCEFIVL